MYDTMRDEFVWHSKSLKPLLRFISLVEMTKSLSNFYNSTSSMLVSRPRIMNDACLVQERCFKRVIGDLKTYAIS